MRIKMLKNALVGGKFAEAGLTYNFSQKDSEILINLGKAKAIKGGGDKQSSPPPPGRKKRK